MTSLGYVFGFIGAALMVASYLMKSMLPLRMVALSANVFLVVYALQGGSWPTVALYLAMIPINVKKVLEIRKLIRAIENAKADSPVGEWLLPHMTRRQAKAGETLWNKGDKATEMLYVQSGRLNLLEYDESIGPGSIVGEIGLFAPDNRRTRTIVCATDCTLYSLSAEGMAKLYFQNPKLGYHVMRLIVARLMHDADVASRRREDRAHIGDDPMPAVP
ncbi:MAG: cyclic nucleotide-binding domain-containing protein [Aquincola sp.]|nr:cyclic nucleotide-binding domain-containing protein [Aquincola sp.]